MMPYDIVVASADIDETLRFELHVNRIISSDELRAIGDVLIQGADQIKQDTKRVPS